LKDLVINLNELVAEGHGDMRVFAIHGASGDVNEVRYGHISNYVGECGPFDLAPNEQYISVYIGN
jgi:hypothetical protein